MPWHIGVRYIVLLPLLMVFACEQRRDLAPVVEIHWKAANQHAKKHVVARGETLYAVAFRYDKDYRELARLNRIKSPYLLHIGQVLRLQQSPAPSSVKNSTTKHVKVASNKSTVKQSSPKKYIDKNQTLLPKAVSSSSPWIWPTSGKIVGQFVPQKGKKGIDIAGRRGDKIHAAAGGVVAYAGNGLAGYGNLIIIKHDHQFLTAYANNSRILVREGQRIQSGQIIAEMGLMDRRFWGLHFEMRKQGKPINPLQYLQRA